MPTPVTIILAVFWCVMAYRAFERGDNLMAVVLLAVGVALTFYRLRSARKPSPNSPTQS